MRVLVIPEDQHTDQFIVKPVLEALFADLGKPARVVVLPEPRLRGAEDALDQELIGEIVRENAAMTDLFVLVVDRDCNRQKHEEKASARESESTAAGARFVACLAIQEIECWLLALYEQEEIGASWSEVREHCDPKEAYAEPLLDGLGHVGPGGGRKAAMRRLSGHWKRLLSRCPEVGDLRTRIQQLLDRA